MKKRFVALVAVLAFVLGGGVSALATVNYYQEWIADQKQVIEDEITQEYYQRYEQLTDQNHAEMVAYMEGKRDEVYNEIHAYMDRKLEDNANERLEINKWVVDQEAEGMFKSLKELVDSLPY